jgi:hypothetical protein
MAVTVVVHQGLGPFSSAFGEIQMPYN